MCSVRKSRSNRVPATRKGRFLKAFKEKARRAAYYRLAGNMTTAVKYDDDLEEMYREARDLGINEDRLVGIEERGRQQGGRDTYGKVRASKES